MKTYHNLDEFAKKYVEVSKKRNYPRWGELRFYLDEQGIQGIVLTSEDFDRIISALNGDKRNE